MIIIFLALLRIHSTPVKSAPPPQKNPRSASAPLVSDVLILCTGDGCGRGAGPDIRRALHLQGSQV